MVRPVKGVRDEDKHNNEERDGHFGDTSPEAVNAEAADANNE
ncbi:MAG: hypothetical protein ACTSPY_08790 [Candidatus Helarchaeota archaeon]